MRRLLPPLLAALSACTADDGAYPSLAARPIENISLAEPEAPRVAAAAADPALDAQVAGIERDRAVAARSFDAAAVRVERAVRAARPARVGTPGWIDAQTALAELDGLRSAHGDVLGRLEALSAERIEALLPPYPRLDAALDTGWAAAAAQTRRIDAIGALLPAG